MHGWFAEATATIIRGEIVARMSGREGVAGNRAANDGCAHDASANAPTPAEMLGLGLAGGECHGGNGGEGEGGNLGLDRHC